MKTYGRGSLHGVIGDFVVYRNLVPADRRLPPLAQIRARVGIREGEIPRKSEPVYGAVLAHLLREARTLTAPPASLQRLIYVGDTRMLDGTAFVNICEAGGWPGIAFIGADGQAPPQIDVVEQGDATLYLANRWTALRDFEAFCQRRGFGIDEHTAVVVDIDKTALGARGRNDGMIDRARVEAVRRTVGQAVGDGFDAERFRTAYDCLSQAEFHPFTGDNQDYLAYICLVLGSGLVGLDAIVNEVRAGHLSTFEQFIADVDARSDQMAPGLRSLHREILDRTQRGDPTPFKAFRRNEYRITIGLMGSSDDSIAAAQLVTEEIVITHEVFEIGRSWRQQGSLLFGLSDKPDEASTPTADLAARGYQPIHRAQTHLVGSDEWGIQA